MWSHDHIGQEDEAMMWSATGGTNYSARRRPIEGCARHENHVLHLKDDEKEFTRAFRLKDIIRQTLRLCRLSDSSWTTMKNRPTSSRRSGGATPAEVEAEEYDSFYKMLTMDFGGASHHIHMRADVPMQFYALLYVPGSAAAQYVQSAQGAGIAALRAQNPDRRIQSRSVAGIPGIRAGRG